MLSTVTDPPHGIATAPLQTSLAGGGAGIVKAGLDVAEPVPVEGVNVIVANA